MASFAHGISTHSQIPPSVFEITTKGAIHVVGPSGTSSIIPACTNSSSFLSTFSCSCKGTRRRGCAIGVNDESTWRPRSLFLSKPSPSNNSRNRSKISLLFTKLICTGLTSKNPRHSAVSLSNSLWPSSFITTKSATQHNVMFFKITSSVKVFSVGSDFELPYACNVLADLGVPALMFSVFNHCHAFLSTTLHAAPESIRRFGTSTPPICNVIACSASAPVSMRKVSSVFPPPLLERPLLSSLRLSFFFAGDDNHWWTVFLYPPPRLDIATFDPKMASFATAITKLASGWAPGMWKRKRKLEAEAVEAVNFCGSGSGSWKR